MEPTPSNPVLVPTPAGVSPTLVGLLRGLGYAAVAGVLSALVAVIGGLEAKDLGDYAWALPLLLAVGRTVEGAIDKVRGQAPQAHLGSRPADPLGYAPAAGLLEVAATPLEPVEPNGDLDTALAVARRGGIIRGAVAAALPRAAVTTVDRVANDLAIQIGVNPDLAADVPGLSAALAAAMPSSTLAARGKVRTAIIRAFAV